MKIILYMPKAHEQSAQFFKKLCEPYDFDIVQSIQEIHPETDLIINRNHGMDYDDQDLSFMSRSKIKMLNSANAHLICRDKLISIDFLKSINLRTPQSYKLVPKNYPYILKTIRGMKGLGVELIQSEKDILKSKFHHDSNIFFQEYIESEEYRYIYFLGYEFYLEKKSQHWKKNLEYSQFEPIDPLDQFSDIASKLKAELNAHFFAVDFFMDESGALIIDINAVVGLNWIESQLNPSKLLKCQEYLSFL